MGKMETAIKHLLEHDPVLAEIVKRCPSPTFVAHTNYYHELVDSIISQQLSVKAARTIEGRFKALFGDEFPSPEQILKKDVEELRAVGLSRPKVRYIQDLAMKIIEGEVRFDTLDQLSNDEIVEELTKVKGIGVWTVHMFLMFCMARLDVLPVGDLGIRNGIMRLYNLEKVPDAAEIEAIAKTNNWHPYESVACWYIWQSLDNTPSV